MRNIKLTLSYDGTHFRGWQIQKQGERTVQDTVQTAVCAICDEAVKLVGAGRTDSGVHALGQVAHFKTRSLIPLNNLHRALNTQLPDDVVVTGVEEVPADFHAQYSAQGKVYQYEVLNRSYASALHRHRQWHVPYKMNVARMRREASSLLGEHDFRAFSAVEGARRVQSTVRTLRRFDVHKRGDVITFTLEADGFLYKMVRNLVGTLVEVGAGQKPEGALLAILKKRSRDEAGVTAKPHGLTLVTVFY